MPVGGVERDLRGRIARRSTEVCSDVGQQAALRSSSPPRRASASPLSLRPTSTQPVNRFFSFHSLSPWRSRTRVYDVALGHGRACQNRTRQQCGRGLSGRPRTVDRGVVARGAGPDGVGSADHVLVAVDRHAGQPGRRVRAAVPGVLPHRRARPHAVLRRSGARRLRAGQRRWPPRRGGARRPARPPAGAAGQPGRAPR